MINIGRRSGRVKGFRINRQLNLKNGYDILKFMSQKNSIEAKKNHKLILTCFAVFFSLLSVCVSSRSCCISQDSNKISQSG